MYFRSNFQHLLNMDMPIHIYDSSENLLFLRRGFIIAIKQIKEIEERICYNHDFKTYDIKMGKPLF